MPITTPDGHSSLRLTPASSPGKACPDPKPEFLTHPEQVGMLLRPHQRPPGTEGLLLPTLPSRFGATFSSLRGKEESGQTNTTKHGGNSDCPGGTDIPAPRRSAPRSPAFPPLSPTRQPDRPSTPALPREGCWILGSNSSNYLYTLHNSSNILLSEAEKPLSC